MSFVISSSSQTSSLMAPSPPSHSFYFSSHSPSHLPSDSSSLPLVNNTPANTSAVLRKKGRSYTPKELYNLCADPDVLIAVLDQFPQLLTSTQMDFLSASGKWEGGKDSLNLSSFDEKMADWLFLNQNLITMMPFMFKIKGSHESNQSNQLDVKTWNSHKRVVPFPCLAFTRSCVSWLVQSNSSISLPPCSAYATQTAFQCVYLPCHVKFHCRTPCEEATVFIVPILPFPALSNWINDFLMNSSAPSWYCPKTLEHISSHWRRVWPILLNNIGKFSERSKMYLSDASLQNLIFACCRPKALTGAFSAFRPIVSSINNVADKEISNPSNPSNSTLEHKNREKELEKEPQPVKEFLNLKIQSSDVINMINMSNVPGGITIDDVTDVADIVAHVTHTSGPPSLKRNHTDMLSLKGSPADGCNNLNLIETKDVPSGDQQDHKLKGNPQVDQENNCENQLQLPKRQRIVRDSVDVPPSTLTYRFFVKNSLCYHCLRQFLPKYDCESPENLYKKLSEHVRSCRNYMPCLTTAKLELELDFNDRIQLYFPQFYSEWMKMNQDQTIVLSEKQIKWWIEMRRIWTQTSLAFIGPNSLFHIKFKQALNCLPATTISS